MSAAIRLLCILAALAGVSAHAQGDAATAIDAKKAELFKSLENLKGVDLSVPDSPAFNVLGISPSEVQRPGTLRDLAVGLRKGIDENGRVKSGVALDFMPMSLFTPQLIRGGTKYKDDKWLQAATRTTVSIATTADEKNESASKLAWGLRVGVFDYGDPGLHYENLVNCFKTVPMTTIPPGRTVDTQPPEQDVAKAKAELEKCLAKEPEEASWAQPSLYLGYGKSWYSNSGKVTDNSPAVGAWWATFSMGRDGGATRTRFLFQLHASSKSDERVEDPADATKLVRQDSKLYVGRVNMGRDEWRTFLDAGQKKLTLANTTKESLRHLGIGAEFKIKGMGDNVWLQIGSVRESGYTDGKSVNKASLAFKFGSEPVFELPGK
jgi:hypothetical protein